MTLFITQNGQRLGPYSLDDARRLVASGQLQNSDWAWYEGLTDWIPLERVPGFVSAPAFLPPAPPVPLPGQPSQLGQPGAGHGDSTLLIRRLVTAVVLFGLLFIFFFMVIFFLALMVGGVVVGMEASAAQHDQPGNFQQGYALGHEAGRAFGAKYGGLIAGIAALVSLFLSAVCAGWAAFSRLLPWCRPK